jgi:ATP-dependent DNA helicase RecQ
LEHEDHLAFNENVFLPARAGFTASKELLSDFEKTHSSLEPVIKCLLRTYEGIVDDLVSIHEKQIARLTKQTIDEVKKQLNHLQSLGIIKYLPMKETPQINFLTDRAPAQSLHIDYENYLQRRKQYELRTEVMLRYLELSSECRSRYISAYFGDNNVKECNICDVCLQHKNFALTEEEFKKIEQKIYQHITDKGIALKELQNNLNGIKKEKFWKVMEFLQSEKRITVNDYGIVKIT